MSVYADRLLWTLPTGLKKGRHQTPSGKVSPQFLDILQIWLFSGLVYFWHQENLREKKNRCESLQATRGQQRPNSNTENQRFLSVFKSFEQRSMVSGCRLLIGSFYFNLIWRFYSHLYWQILNYNILFLIAQLENDLAREMMLSCMKI